MSYRNRLNVIALSISAFTVIPAFLLGAAPASASVITGPLTKNWSITYDDTQVKSLSFTSTNPAKPDEGNLVFTEVFNTTSPISIKFEQTAMSAIDNFGLRLFMKETVQNNAGSTFSGMDLVLNDPTMASPQGFPSHPGTAHFHPTNSAATGQLFAPFASGGAATDFNTAGSISLTAGTLASGTSAVWSNFGLHEYEDANRQRNFTLVETPTGLPTQPPTSVPEPGTMMLLGGGLACLFGRRERGAWIRDAGALIPTPPGVMRRGRSSGVPGPACG